MPSEIPYGTFANYSPRGNSEVSIKSRRTCGGIKRGNTTLISQALPMLAKPEAQVLQPFLNPKVTLVPAPRSAPLAQGALWPAKVIADILAGGGYGSSVLPAIDRVTAVKKSSSSSKAAGRPLIHEHVASMRVNPGGGLFPPEQITIVDDVLTMGRMSAACAELLRCAYPEAEIRMFAMIRTQGMVENIDKIFDPSVGVITAYDSGKSHREP